MVQFPPLCNRPQRHSRNRILRDGLAAVPRTILPGPNTGTWGTPFHAAMNRAGPGPPADLVFFLPVHLGQPRVASGPRRNLPLRAHRFLAEPIRQASTEDVWRQVAASRSAQRTIGDDPGVRHRMNWCRVVFATPLAAHCVVANAGCGQVTHATQYRRGKSETYPPGLRRIRAIRRRMKTEEPRGAAVVRAHPV